MKHLTTTILLTLLMSMGAWADDELLPCGDDATGLTTCIFIFSDGRKYEGDFKDGLQHGYGIYTWPNGGQYKGYWKEGNRSGQGSHITPTDIYTGEWKDNKRHGYGVYTDTVLGIEKAGYWEADSFIGDEVKKPLNKSIKLEDYYPFIALIVLGLFFFIYLYMEAKKKENGNQVDDEEEHDAKASEESEILNVNESAEKEILVEADSHLPEQRRLFFGLSIRGWSWLFVSSLVVIEIISELSAISRGYSLFFFFDRPRFTFENNLAGVYWASIASAIYLLFDYLKPKFKKQSSKVASNETELISNNSNDSKEDKLKKIKDLYDKKLISKEVYEKQQLEILSE